MPENRKQIPRADRAEVLYRNWHSCCICMERGGQVILHHIDGDPSNNKPANLAVLCLDHHAQVEQTGRVSASYQPEELKRYKRSWEAQVAKRMGFLAEESSTLAPVTPVELLATEILSLPDDSALVEQKISQLSDLYTWRGITPDMLSAIEYISFLAPMNKEQTSIMMAELLEQLSYHLAGPEHVPMTDTSRGHLHECIEMAGHISAFAASFMESVEALRAGLNTLTWYHDIGIWYDDSEIAEAVVKKLEDTVTQCTEPIKDNGPFSKGVQAVADLSKALLSTLKSENKNWKGEVKRLHALLKRCATILDGRLA